MIPFRKSNKSFFSFDNTSIIMNNDTTKLSSFYSMDEIECSITIKKADIFTQEGLKVIHCPSTYETDTNIIFEDSLIGQFMKKYDAERKIIDSQISSFVDGITTKTINRETGRFKLTLGTACPIKVGGEDYCLCAFNEQTRRDYLKDLSIADYISYWENVWVNLPQLKSQNISVAVPGGNKVTVGSARFILSQKIGVIVYTFFKSLAKKKPCDTLTICLYGKGADKFDYYGWEKTILPFLFQMSKLPISWRVELPVVQSTTTVEGGVTKNTVKTEGGNSDKEFAFDSLICDLNQIADNIDKVNGREILQKEGRSRSEYLPIEVDTSIFRQLINHLGDNSLIRSHFSTSSKKGYDPNSLFQLLGILWYDTGIFGELNKQNIVRICLGYTEVDHTGEFCLDVKSPLPEPWSKLGTNIDALSKKFKKQYEAICGKSYFQELLSFISKE